MGKTIKCKCLFCGKIFYTWPCRIKQGCGKHCSRKCQAKSQKGKKHSIETKAKISYAHSGSKSYRWKGGRNKTYNGYIIVYKPDHPFSFKNKYIYEHRLIVEKELGRYLDSKERVHHKNEIKTDNRIENLKLFPNESQHQKFHHKIKGGV